VGGWGWEGEEEGVREGAGECEGEEVGGRGEVRARGALGGGAGV